MRIMVVSDEPSRALWDFVDKEKLKGIDLILSAGDLPAEYLEFLVTFSDCPLLYVRGNHDTKYNYHAPEGCVCIENTIYEYEGVRILGLGGSMRYVPHREDQYSEKEMARRIRRLYLKLLHRRGFDILLTHAPAKGIHDWEGDLCHRGFQSFLNLMDRYHPQYMVHGHMHLNYGANIPRTTCYGGTTIVNAYERYEITL